jgi:hypothetical protein
MATSTTNRDEVMDDVVNALRAARLPRQLRILIKHAVHQQSHTGLDVGGIVAIGMDFPVRAVGADPMEAVEQFLINLASYLSTCAEIGALSQVPPSDEDSITFKEGQEIKVPRDGVKGLNLLAKLSHRLDIMLQVRKERAEPAVACATCVG